MQNRFFRINRSINKHNACVFLREYSEKTHLCTASSIFHMGNYQKQHQSSQPNHTSSQSIELIQKVYRALSQKCSIKQNDTLLLCVSAGVDSMAMLHLMAEVRRIHFKDLLDIQVINFDHNLRPEAKEEAIFVKKWCNTYGFPFHSKVREPSAAFGKSGVPCSAREWRRQECLQVLETIRANISHNVVSVGVPKSVIVTAHHSDDQVETVLMKILRGAHVTHLHGMLPLSPCGCFAKPLLDVSKRELVEFIEAFGQKSSRHAREPLWMEDSSNALRLYKRNAVRHEAIPVLANLAGGLEALTRRVTELSEQSLELRQWLDNEATTFINSQVTFNSEFDFCEFSVQQTSSFHSLPSPVQAEIIHLLVLRQTQGLALPYQHIKNIVTMLGTPAITERQQVTVTLRKSWIATRVGNVVRIQRKGRDGLANSHHAGTRKSSYGGVSVLNSLPSSAFEVDIISANSTHNGASSLYETSMTLYNLQPGTTLNIRLSKRGDRFSPTTNRAESLVRFLANAGVPSEARVLSLVIELLSSNVPYESDTAASSVEDPHCIECTPRSQSGQGSFIIGVLVKENWVITPAYKNAHAIQDAANNMQIQDQGNVARDGESDRTEASQLRQAVTVRLRRVT